MKRLERIFFLCLAALPLHSELIPGMDWIIDFFGKDSVKKEDSAWMSPSKVHQEKPQLNEGAEAFFQSPLSQEGKESDPLEVHFFGLPEAPSALILQTPSSSAALPEFSLYDRPLDAIEGGLKTAKSKAMKRAIESASEGAVYEYLIGLETTSPLLASAVKQIQTWANQLNAAGIQSYETAVSRASGGLMQILEEEILACQHEQIASGRELLEARTLCQNQEKRKKTLKSMRKKNPLFFAGSYNLGSELLSSMGLQGALKELFLNLTGTLVKTESEGIVFYPPLTEAAAKLLYDGSPIQNGYCLEGKRNIKRKTIDSSWQPRKERWRTLVENMQKKLMNEDPFTDEEQKCFSRSDFPVLPLMTLSMQYQGSGADALRERLIMSLAREEVFQFVEEALQRVLAHAKALRASQIAMAPIEAYIGQLEEALASHRRAHEAHRQRGKQEQDLLRDLLLLENRIRSEERSRKP